ncbi:hypothetical protein [Modestobacter roseus]|uniref:hypothetical protein n=1 Tax=Modestobacter roseus TaxID=1181884 RepID=UPI00129612F2|nr:hypothetical protein [Modestobacter roseus]MQA35283.1 hypothetical protein [Modestobacter roseus]
MSEMPPGEGRAVFDATFGDRVRALLRGRPLAVDTGRQSWAEQRYDLPTFALAAIDAIIARQGFDDELTYGQAVAVVVRLAAASHPQRPPEEHTDVAEHVLDTLLNRREREAPFRYRVSDYALDADQITHRAVTLEFRLVTEHEDAARDTVVLRATTDAINALVGGLEFDVEDEQAANDLIFSRQLERGAFGQAERAAERNRGLSVRYAEEVRALLADTVRDIRSVADRWADEVPALLSRNRDHILERLNAEQKLLEHVRSALDTAEDTGVAATAGRIAALLEECRRRHTELHGRIVTARNVFLEEQTRQSFRPLGRLGNPDVGATFTDLLTLPRKLAQEPAETFAVLTAGTQVPRLVRLGDLLEDLLAARRERPDPPPPDVEEIGDDDPPAVSPTVLAAAAAVVADTGLPAGLGDLLTAVRRADLAEGVTADDVERVLVLAVLWTYAPEAVTETATAVDAAAAVLGPGAVVDTDGAPLDVDGWAGDDLLVAGDEDGLYRLAQRRAQATPRTTDREQP